MRRILVAAVAVALALATAGAARAQVGNLIWEDNFNDLGNWLKVTGNGSWGWGTGELEFYKNENVDVAGIPGEPGNLALRIIARQESGAGIVDQWGNPLNYTSGKVVSKSFVSVRYGMIESRVWIPNLDLGGFPAVWLLGTANYAWPACGEIDMMEMGLKKAFRDLHDTHNGGNGLNNSTVNQMVGANAIFYSAGAVTPENPSGAASLSWDPDDDYEDNCGVDTDDGDTDHWNFVDGQVEFDKVEDEQVATGKLEVDLNEDDGDDAGELTASFTASWCEIEY